MKYEGWTKDDFYSYRPAVCYLGQYLYNRYPNTEIYFILNTDLKPEIGAAMQEVCERFGFSLIVLQDISRTQGHPNIEGMKSIADQFPFSATLTLPIKVTSHLQQTNRGIGIHGLTNAPM